MSLNSILQQQFIDLYGSSTKPIRIFHAPGRVNLIGEHIDYNGGYVLPAALNLGTTMLIRQRNDEQFRFASTNFALQKTISTHELQFHADDSWVNYPKGVLSYFQKNSYTLHGYDVLYNGAIPNGAGLSSSASIEVVTAFGLSQVEGYAMKPIELASLAQNVENTYLGLNSGIMDPFASAMGKVDHAMLLRCDTLEYRYVPLAIEPYQIVIANTNKRRELVDSAYNTRKNECEQGLAMVNRIVSEPVSHLCALNLQQWEAIRSEIADNNIKKRIQHVVAENERVLKATDVLQKNDFASFGKLLIQSHESLRDLYEVSCPELDVLVDAALQQPGVLGSRMTGAGFGGCTVSIVHKHEVDSFIEHVGKAYSKQTNRSADFYVTDIGGGAEEREADKSWQS